MENDSASGKITFNCLKTSAPLPPHPQSLWGGWGRCSSWARTPIPPTPKIPGEATPAMRSTPQVQE